ncbi:MAG: MBOAT family O-acyltransferase, partial [Planctomycetota bacterium]
MLFHTWHFFLFFLVVYPGFLLLRKTAFKNLWLLAASYFFYAWWNPLYLLLIVYSTALDYFVALRLDSINQTQTPEVAPSIWHRRKSWLTLSVINNLFLLGFFKYAGFVTDNLNALLTGLNVDPIIPQPNILLPIGISFYTFQSMSYTIDVYRGRFGAERNFVRFATFVAFFPQLIAGPIERAKSLLPQLRQTQRISAGN